MGTRGFETDVRLLVAFGLIAALAGCEDNSEKPSGSAAADKEHPAANKEPPAAAPADPRAALLAYAKPPEGLKTPLEKCKAVPDLAACQTACDAGEADACFVLRMFALTGAGGAKVLPVAEQHAILRKEQENAERKCRAGDVWSCSRAKTLYRGGELNDPAKAEELETFSDPLFKKACEGGDPRACNQFTVDRRVEGETEKWKAIAEKVAKEACDGGNWQGCDKLIGIHEKDPAAVETARTRMIGLAEKQCLEEGDAYACRTAADHHSGGRHGKKDVARSLRLYGVACQQGEYFDCETLVKLHEKGGPLADAEIATAFTERACALGSPMSCGKLPAKPAAAEPAPAPKAPPIGAPTAEPTASIAEDVAAFRAAPADDPKALAARARDLAGRGRPARAALLELAADPKLSKNHRDAAGLRSTEVLLFSPDESIELALKSDNGMQVVTAARNLALLGGDANKQILAKIAARFKGRDDKLVTAVGSMIDAMPGAARLSAHQLKLLDKVYSLRKREDVNIYAAALVVDHRDNLGWALERMLTLPMERDHQLTIIAIKQRFERK